MAKTIVVLGPTASGKTRLACALAANLHLPIISADSRQVFKEMNLGTGKDLSEYQVHQQSIPYFLIDILHPGDEFDLSVYLTKFKEIFDSLNHNAIICGGSGMYIQGILEGYTRTQIKPNETLRKELEKFSNEDLLVLYKSLHSQNLSFDFSTRKRLIRAIEILKDEAQIPSASPLKDVKIIGLGIPADIRWQKIEKRLKERFDSGMMAEVERLRTMVPDETLIRYGLEYKFITEHLQGQYDFDTLFEKLNIAIRQFSKRQMTFFRSMEKKGHQINWLDATLPFDILVQKALEICQD